MLPFAALLLLVSIPFTRVDARPVVAAAVVVVPLCATLVGVLLLGRGRLHERAHWQLGANSQIPAGVQDFEGRLHQGIAIDLAIGLLLLLVATVSVSHQRARGKASSSG